MKKGTKQPDSAAEITLRTQQLNLLDVCISNLNDIVLVTEADPTEEPGPKIVFVNKAFERLTGYTSQEALGRSPRFLQGEKTDRKVLSEIREALARKEPIRRQLANYGKDGSEYWLDIDIVPIFDPTGKCTHFAAIERDVSLEKKNAESLELFQTLVDQSNDAIEIIDPVTSKFLNANDMACSRLGYSREEMLSLSVADVFAARDPHFNFLSAVEEIKISGSKIVEGRHKRKDGFTFPIEASVRYINLKGGYLISVVRDITERKEAEAQLIWKTAFFEAKVHSSLDGVLIVDSNGKKILQNQKMIDLWNIPKDLAENENDQGELGWVTSQVKNPREFAEKVAYLYAHPDEVSNEEVYLINGRVFDRYSAPVRGKDGKYYGRIWSFHDITNRKRSEERITEQAALLDKARDAILVRDLKGNILFWNKGAERIYGWTSDEVLGKNVSTLLYSEPKIFEKINEVNIREDEWSGELRHLTKDHREITIEARWSLIRDENGQPKSILAINTDITEKKRIESQFMRAQRMESIGNLAGGIAHDLNNILGPILMSIELLKITEDPDRAKSILQTIEESARRGGDIVGHILSFARGLEGERISIRPEQLLRDVENIVRDTFPKNIRLEFNIPKDIWSILGDPTQVHQIFLNLCVNARDAMPNGGNLAIQMENCILDQQYAAMNPGASPGRYVNINVSDSGKGIPADHLDKIFEPFFTTKKVHEGTGLGLSTVMAVIKGHEGLIDVTSEPGRGTTFKIHLPAAEISSRGKKEKVKKAGLPRGKGELILVVDDEPSIVTITRQTLEAFGYKVMTASDGAEAIAVYAESREKIAVVLTDMMMPIMDGAATIQALSRINPGVKIIATSGLKSGDSLTQNSGACVKHFLKKPHTAATLLMALRAILHES